MAIPTSNVPGQKNIEPFYEQVRALDHISPNDSFRCFLTTNEHSMTKVLNKLNCSNGSDSLHIGCSGWQNLNIICKSKPNYSIIVDVAKSTRMVYQVTEKEIQNSATRQEFLEKVAIAFQKTQIAITIGKKSFYKEDISNEIKLELNNQNSWLSSDEKFEQIKKMFSEKRIVFLGVDFREINIFHKIKQIMQNNGLILDTIYLSNVIDWLPEGGKESFFNSINAVLNEHTQVIYSKFESWKNRKVEELRQHLVLGEEVRRCVPSLSFPPHQW